MASCDPHIPHKESLRWLSSRPPIWSRLLRRNSARKLRNLPISKLREFHVEIKGRLWSLWSCPQPKRPAPKSDPYLSTCVVACCAASAYPLLDWSPELLDRIMTSGKDYFQQSMKQMNEKVEVSSLEQLNPDCRLAADEFLVYVEQVMLGRLYQPLTGKYMNLGQALTEFFQHFRFGILLVRNRALTVGYQPGQHGGYFMYDCQEQAASLFPKDQAGSYVLRTRQLQLLLYCIVVTLQVKQEHVEFSLYKVDMIRVGHR